MRQMHHAVPYLVAICAVTVTATAHAHIKMLKPASWVTTDSSGNPQKEGPCGTATPGSAVTNTITTFKAGEEITVEWTETVDHPGHYRIALAKDRAELQDPDITPTSALGCDYAAGAVPTEPHGNVLLDNLYPTTNTGGTRMYSQKVKLPNEPCEKCTLQLIQWMTKHPPSCLYYQCADIEIVAADGAAGSGAAGGAAAGGGAAGTTSSAAGSGAGGATGTSAGAGQSASGAGAGVPVAGRSASAGATATAGATPAAGTGAGSSIASAGTGAPAAAAPASADSSSCSVTQPGRGASLPRIWLSLLLGLALLVGRRKR